MYLDEGHIESEPPTALYWHRQIASALPAAYTVARFILQAEAEGFMGAELHVTAGPQETRELLATHAHDGYWSGFVIGEATTTWSVSVPTLLARLRTLLPDHDVLRRRP